MGWLIDILFLGEYYSVLQDQRKCRKVRVAAAGSLEEVITNETRSSYN
jgi:hypothetical protein